MKKTRNDNTINQRHTSRSSLMIFFIFWNFLESPKAWFLMVLVFGLYSIFLAAPEFYITNLFINIGIVIIWHLSRICKLAEERS